jgi:filamentous hemagglutinin family protein
VVKHRAFKRRLIQVAVASCFATAAHANPTGPSVVSGAATFNAVGKNLTVTNSPGTIIHWQGFSIRPDEVTRFVQSGAASAVLNRVVGPEHSQLLGQLLSNGKVFLINPNGVTVGAGARIDTAGFVASSLALSNEDFLAGKFRFTDPGNAGKVTNAGTIHAHSGGPVYLVAPTVENHGVITAPNGEVMLGAGKTVELVSVASPHLRVQVQAGGEALNVGQLVAASGRVGLYGAAIRNAGLISADSAQVTAAGTVVLKASKDVTLDPTSVVTANGAQGGSVHVQAEGGTLLADGRIEAKGSAAQGGEVKLLGEQVGLVGAAAVDASGAAGGGQVLVGGDYQGGNADVQNAKATFVGADASLRADAGESGNGGTIVVWADGATRFQGAASARGGATAGDGGFVEVSGKDWLAFTGRVDTTANAGRTGMLLLDPTDITISTAATSNGTCPPAGPCFTLTGSPAAANLNVTDLLNALANTNVTVNTASAAPSNGDITVANAVAYNNAADRTLTLQANRNVTLNAGITTGAAAGRLSVVLAADSDANGTGNVALNAAVSTRGGAFTASGVNVTSAAAGTVTTSGVTAGRAAGDLTITAGTTGAVNLAGALAATGAAGAAGGPGANAGTVSVSGGTVTLGAVTALGGAAAAASNREGGQGGTVNVTKTGAAATAVTLNGLIDARGGNANGTGSGNTGGAVTVNAGAGAIATTGASLATLVDARGGTGQAGGSVNLAATGNINIAAAGNKAILASGGAASANSAGRNAGSITLASTGGTVTARVLTAAGSAGVGAGNNAGGSGGAIAVSGTGVVLNGAVSAIGGNSVNAGAGGSGGTVTVTGTTGSVSSVAAGTISASGGRGQDAGTINVSAGPTGTVNLAGTLTASGGVAETASAGQNGGTINVSGGTITVATMTAAGSAAAAGSNAQGGNGGAISLTKTGAGATAVTLNNALSVAGGNANGSGNGGTGGTVTIDAGAGSVATTAASLGTLINARGGTGQNGGAVTITAAGNVTLAGAGNRDIATAGGAASASGAAPGAGLGRSAGNVTISGASVTTDRILATGSNAAAGSNKAGGSGGAVSITANGAAGTLGATNTISVAGGARNGTGGGGSGGTIALTNLGTGATTATALTASGGAGQNGGTVTVNGAGTVAVSGAITTAAGAAPTGAAGRSGGNVALTGSTVAAAAITTSGSAGAAGGNAGGAAGAIALDATGGAPLVTLNGNLTAAGGNATGAATGGNGGAVTIADAAVFNANRTITASAGTGGAPAGGNVTFGGTVNSQTATARTLTVNTQGTTRFAGAVGGTNALASLTTNAGGTTRIDGGSVRTTGAQSYGDAVALGADTTLTSTASGSVSFAGTVDSADATARALTVNTGGATTFTGAVGGTNALASLTTDAAGTTAVNGGLVRTTGGQTYNDPLTLGGATTLRTTGGGSVTANGVVTATAGTLTLDTGAGNATLTNAANDFGTVVVTSGNAVQLRDANALALGASTLGTLTAQAGAGLTVNGAITASGGGSSIILAGTTFTNNAGAAALDPGAGRWVVYSSDPATDAFGGLASGNQALWGRAYPAAVPEPGNRYAFTTQPTLTFTSTDVAKTYGQDATAAVAAAYVVSGFVNAALYGNVFTQDTAANAVSGAPAVTSLGSPATAAVAGSPYAINVNTAGVTSPTGYAIAGSSAGLLTVNPAALSVTADNQTKTYGQTLVFTGTEFTSAGLQNGETIGSVTLASAGAAAAASVAGSPYAITASNATGGTFNPANYTITYNDGVLTVGPAALTVTANNQTKTYGNTFVFTGTEFTPTGLQNGETIGSVTLASAGAPPTATVLGGPYAITASNAAGGTFNPANYTITYANGVMTVTPLPIVVTANNQAKVYGQPDPALTFTAPTVNGDVLNGSLTRAPGETVPGSPYAITQGTVTNANNPNYSITFVNGQLVITPAPLTIAADNKTRAYGDANPPLTATFTGLTNGDTPAAIPGVTLTTPAVPASNVGNYTINVASGANPNYTITYVNGQLAITPAPLTIAANDASRRFATPNPPFTATATGFKLGQTVGDLNGTLAFSTPATLLSPPGRYAITPGGVSSANYTITFVNGQLLVEATAPPTDQALVTATGRSAAGPDGLGERTNGARTADCLTVERPGERRVLGRCF